MNSRKEETAMVKKLLRPVLFGTIAGALCCLLLLLIMAAIMAGQDVPQAAVTPLAVVAAAVGAFLGGLICARMAGNKGLLFGAACGLVLYLVVLLAGFAVMKDIRGSYAVIKLLIMLGCAAVGGVLGVNLRKR